MFILRVMLLVIVVSLDCCEGHSLTFQNDDPETGTSVTCDRCAPGTYLLKPCTANQKSNCAQCPTGSFTELWNFIPKCLRCGNCGENEVVERECSPQHDCTCKCKDGYFMKKEYASCVKHTECALGYGAVTKGSSEKDTVCKVCQSGFYSNSVSAHDVCVAHTVCGSRGQFVVLKGSIWHDAFCATCGQLKSQDGADYLREILPSFFVRQRLTIKRMRRFVLNHWAKPEEKPSRETVMSLHRRNLNELINQWVHSASTKQLRLLPTYLNSIRAPMAGIKIEEKLRGIDHQKAQCVLSENST